MANVCPRCNEWIRRRGSFCPRCGHALPGAARRFRWAMWLLAAALAWSIGVCGICQTARLHSTHLARMSRRIAAPESLVPSFPRSPSYSYSRANDANYTEITLHPRVLADRRIAATDLRLHGVGLYDTIDRIPREQVLERTADHIICTDGNVFILDGRRICEIDVLDVRLLSRAGIRSLDACRRIFGLVSENVFANGDRFFRNPDAGRDARWSTRLGCIDRVRIYRDPVAQ